jgi:predicted oxidoreductase (fatty acid repression mutant protein)
MNKSVRDAIIGRRTFYAITDKSPISDAEIEEILKVALLHVPSAFNSQSTRLVLLLHHNHKKVWQIATDNLRKVVAKSDFAATEAKLNSFAAGYGTILFYEDRTVVEGLQTRFPLYKDNFPIWSNQASAMHQFAVWTLLEEAGFGVSLQHYSNLIYADVRKEWNIDSHWELIAEMPFGLPTADAGKKEFLPLENRLKSFK